MDASYSVIDARNTIWQLSCESVPYRTWHSKQPLIQNFIIFLIKQSPLRYSDLFILCSKPNARSGWNEVPSQILILQVTCIGDKFMRETAKYFTYFHFMPIIRYLPKKIFNCYVGIDQLQNEHYLQSLDIGHGYQHCQTQICSLQPEKKKCNSY